MSANTWVGGAQPIADLWTLTPGSVGIGNTFTVTINNKSVTFTATATNVANVTAGVVALCKAANAPPEFKELTWTDNTTNITAASTAGVPVGPVTTTPSGGTATFATAHTTTATGPNFWDNAANWSLDAVPVGADDVYINGTADDILYNLDQHTITLTSLTFDSPGTSGIKIGLPVRNANGYGEYRKTYLQIGITTLKIINGSARVKIDGYTVQSAVTVGGTATSADKSLGIPAFIFKGTHASNTLTALGGTIGIAYFGGEVATVATLKKGNAVVLCGAGCTLTTVTSEGKGQLTTQSAVTTYSIYPGSDSITHTGGAVTTLNHFDGNLSYQSTGTITTLNGGGKGVLNCEDNPAGRTITSTNLGSGYTIDDRAKSITHTNPIALQDCSIDDVTLHYGFGRNIQIT